MQVDTFEDVLSLAGDLGRWQWLVLAMLMPVTVVFEYQHTSYVYRSALPLHWCQTKDVFQPRNWSNFQVRNFTLPSSPSGRSGEWNQCEIHARNYSKYMRMSYEDAMEADGSKVPSNSWPCRRWEYDNTSFLETTVTEWDLICRKMALRPTLQTGYMVGTLVGAIAIGIVSDRVGRKRALQLSLLAMTFGSWCSSFSPSYPVLLASRVLTGFGAVGTFSVSTVLIVEVVARTKRAQMSMALAIGQGIGRMMWAGVSFFLQKWRLVDITVASISSVVLIYCWFLPESPRWLLLKKRWKEATKQLRQIAKVNKNKMPDDENLQQLLKRIHAKEMEAESQRTGKTTKWQQFLVMARTPEMRSRSIKLYLTWFVVAHISHGAMFLSARLPLSVHLMMFIGGVITLVTRFCVIPLLNRFGRRKVYAICFFIPAPMVAAVAVFPRDPALLTWSLLQLSLIGLSVNAILTLLYSTELFPTEVRSMAISLGSLASRAGCIASPLVVDLVGGHNLFIPSAIFGVLSILAGVIALLLPETTHANLPDTVQDVESSRRRRIVRTQKDDDAL